MTMPISNRQKWSLIIGGFLGFLAFLTSGCGDQNRNPITLDEKPMLEQPVLDEDPFAKRDNTPPESGHLANKLSENLPIGEEGYGVYLTR